ncbi:MAG: helix-turn-helix domain-containing protein [Gammaproteobacteria bacterium]|nr:helix-turn-helix domain-containing protein [Gammaproteobacteria bacterium]
MVESVRAGFAVRFRQALADAGYGESQLKALGNLFGVSSQAVRKWLQGEATPTSARAAQIAEKLGVRRAWLIDGEEPIRSLTVDVVEPSKMRGAKDAAAISISAKEFRLLTHYRSLPVGLQVSLEAVLEGMSKELSAVSRK